MDTKDRYGHFAYMKPSAVVWGKPRPQHPAWRRPRAGLRAVGKQKACKSRQQNITRPYPSPCPCRGYAQMMRSSRRAARPNWLGRMNSSLLWMLFISRPMFRQASPF